MKTNGCEVRVADSKKSSMARTWENIKTRGRDCSRDCTINIADQLNQTLER